MAGSVKILDEVTALDATTADKGIEGRGGHLKVKYYLDIIAITGTWDFTLKFKGFTNTVTLATLASQTTTGLKAFTLDAGFTATSEAIPEPSSVTYNESVAGAITAKLIAVYGD